MEIKRCPFCGAKATSTVYGQGSTIVFRITCSKCGIFKTTTLSTIYAGDFTNVIKSINDITNAWNERVLCSGDKFDIKIE